MKKIALIGCGRISNRHIEAIQTNDNLKIAVVCDLDVEKAKSAAQKTGARATTDMFDIEGVDIVSILTPSGMHPFHTAEIAAKTSVPIIVTEKPVSLTVREAIEMFDRVDACGKRLIPVYQNRYNPLVHFIRTAIDSGRLGKVYSFICNVLWNRRDEYFLNNWHGTRSLDGGVLYTQASHYVDMLHYFFGELSDFHGIGGSLRKLEVYDTISSVISFKCGVVGSLTATVNAYQKNYATELTLIAEKGNIHLSGTNLNTINHWNVEGVDKPDLEFEINHEYGKGHDFMYNHIVNERWEMFPTREEILSGIRLMEKLSY